MVPLSSQTIEHFVKMYGRSARPLTARPTISSEWPSPYTAWVSIQLMPRSSARLIAAIDSRSSCEPQPNCQPPPPTAQLPKPRGVMNKSVFPNCRVCIFLILTYLKAIASAVPQPPRYRTDDMSIQVTTFGPKSSSFQE